MAGHKLILVVDYFSAHETATDVLAALPPRYSLRIQRYFGTHQIKKACHSHWVQYMIDEVDNDHDPSKTVIQLKAMRCVIQVYLHSKALEPSQTGLLKP
ncbi:hypothetical protein GcM3_056017 [Golovinomyces cichoracearum]|uniref:DDE-1 domain-containing protein n=1 Tax=Golovinomyces cichoracearum TaxID=62708 RepID=A0A420IXP4_9PEZI|nr:hypothetical protein GcM3_056017 [Golovinomyces cichoracearum]